LASTVDFTHWHTQIDKQRPRPLISLGVDSDDMSVPVPFIHFLKGGTSASGWLVQCHSLPYMRTRIAFEASRHFA